VASDQSLTVICEIYAWDLSVRGAHVDETHAFFNGSSVFLRAARTRTDDLPGRSSSGRSARHSTTGASPPR
jgi:predicted metalloprotease with PDZ domain